MGKNKYDTLKKNTMIFAIGNIGSSLVSFLLLPLFTNFLSSSEYGEIDFFLVSITMLLPIFTLNFTEVIIRFGLDKKYKINKVISTVMYTIIGIFILNFILILFLNIFKVNLKKYILFSVLLCLNSTYELLKHYVRSLEMITTFAIGDIVYTTVFCVINIVLIIKFKMGMNGYFAAYISAHLIYIFFIMLSTRAYKNIKIKYYDFKYFKEFIKYSLPLIPNSLSSWIISVSDRFMIKIFLGYQNLGIYSVSNKIPQILTTFYSLFFKAWQISSIKELNKSDTEEFYSKIFDILSKFMFGVCILILLGINFIFFIFIGEEFREAINYVPILVLAIVFYALSSFLGTIYTAYKQSNKIFKSTIIAAIINVLLNLILLKKFGVLIACISTLLSYVVLFIYRYYDSKKFMKININIKHILISIILVFIMIININLLGLSYWNIIINSFFGCIYIFMNIKEIKKILMFKR